MVGCKKLLGTSHLTSRQQDTPHHGDALPKVNIITNPCQTFQHWHVSRRLHQNRFLPELAPFVSFLQIFTIWKNLTRRAAQFLLTQANRMYVLPGSQLVSEPRLMTITGYQTPPPRTRRTSVLPEANIPHHNHSTASGRRSNAQGRPLAPLLPTARLAKSGESTTKAQMETLIRMPTSPTQMPTG